MRISDWSSDVCSSDLSLAEKPPEASTTPTPARSSSPPAFIPTTRLPSTSRCSAETPLRRVTPASSADASSRAASAFPMVRSEEHTSELQSLMRISYAVFCLKKKKRMTKIDKHMNEQNIR